jgi:hypothetical protein
MTDGKLILGSERMVFLPNSEFHNKSSENSEGAKTSAFACVLNIAPFIKNENNWVKLISIQFRII